MLLKAIFLVLSLVVATQGQAPGASIGLSDAVYAGTVCQNGCSWNTSELYSIGRVPEANDIVDLKPQNADQSTFAITINVDVPVTIRGFNFGASGSSGLNFVLNIKSGNTFTVTTDTVQFGARSTVNVEQGATLSIGGQTTVNGAMNVAGTASFSGSKPALTVTTTTPLNPLNIVSPSLVLNGGLITAPQGVLIDNYATNLARTPSLTGVGNITSGEVQISGNFKPGSDDNTPGNIYIDGSVRLTSQARIYFNIKNKDEFDHVYITNVINIDGKLLMSPIGGFEPLKGQRFFIMNHTEMIGGFDSVSGSGFTSLFNDKWSIRPDQQNTIVVWNSASSLVASVMVVLVCLVASLL